MAVISQTVMMIPRPSPGQEWSEETEKKEWWKTRVHIKREGNRGAEVMKGDRGDQEEAEADQSAPRGGEAITERGERRRGDTWKFRREYQC